MELSSITLLLSAKYKAKYIYLARIFSSAMITSESTVALNYQMCFRVWILIRLLLILDEISRDYSCIHETSGLKESETSLCSHHLPKMTETKYTTCMSFSNTSTTDVKQSPYFQV